VAVSDQKKLKADRFSPRSEVWRLPLPPLLRFSMSDDFALELNCPACTWRSVHADPASMEARLRAGGFLLNEKTPGAAALRGMLLGSGSRLACPECGSRGLETRPHHAGDGDWQEAVTCEVCRKPIPPERVEALPGVRRCVTCQQAEEWGAAREEPEYCPKCGSPMVLRVSRASGATRYKLFCTGSPPCRL
jgi:ssDNA-binding Zn-finger/Zn-ribbon topoisomerase 1